MPTSPPSGPRSAPAEQPPDPRLARELEALRARISRGDAASALEGCEALLPAHGAVAALHVTRALALSALGRHTEACIAATWAVDRAQESPAAWTTLGDAMLRAGQAGAAQAAYGQALAKRPDDAAAWARLGDALRQRGLVERAATAYERAVELDPALPEGRVGRAEVRSWLGIDDGGAGDARLGAALAAGEARAHEVLASVLGRLGHWEEALSALERSVALGADGAALEPARVRALLSAGRVHDGLLAWAVLARRAPDVAPIPGVPHWPSAPGVTSEAPGGRTIAVSVQADLGQTLALLRWVGVAADRGARVVLRAPDAWHGLLRGGRGVGAVVAPGEASIGADVQAPLASLPAALGVAEPPADPALAPDPARRALWHRVLAAGGLRIGAAAHAEPPHAEEHLRAPGIRALAPLADVPGVHLLTLLPARAGDPPVAWAEALGEHLHADPTMQDLMAAITCMDLVIASEGPVAHLAAALGVPTWVLLTPGAGWPWRTLPGRRPLYGSVRTFVQPRPGAWGEVVVEVGAALRRMAWNRRER